MLKATHTPTQISITDGEGKLIAVYDHPSGTVQWAGAGSAEDLLRAVYAEHIAGEKPPSELSTIQFKGDKPS